MIWVNDVNQLATEQQHNDTKKKKHDNKDTYMLTMNRFNYGKRRFFIDESMTRRDLFLSYKWPFAVIVVVVGIVTLLKIFFSNYVLTFYGTAFFLPDYNTNYTNEWYIA